MITYNTISELNVAQLIVGDVVQILGESTIGDRAYMMGIVREETYISGNRLIPITQGLKVEIMPELVIQSGDVSDSESSAAGSTVRRKLKDRFAETLSVKDFGAVGDGVNDDTAAFSAAMNSGKNIWVPKTDSFYKITSLVTVANSFSMKGDNNALIKLSGGVAGDTHFLIQGEDTLIQGMTFQSETRGIIFKVEPSGATDIERFIARDCTFLGGFYGVRAGDSISVPVVRPTKRIIIDNCTCSTTNTQNAGHYICFNVNEVRYTNSKAIGGRNTSAFGAARCKDVVVMGCIEQGVAQTVTTVEAGCQIEDAPTGKAVIMGNTFEHDIWVSAASNVLVANNHCRQLRISTGSAHSMEDMNNILFTGNTTGRIDIQRYGNIPANTQIVNAMFRGNFLNTKAYSNMGTEFTSSYIIQGSQCGEVVFSENQIITEASTNSVRISRGSKMKLIFRDCDLGSKPHVVSGSGGRILTTGNMVNNLFSHGLSDIADILLSFKSGSSIDVPESLTNIPFNDVLKNQNSEYEGGIITPLDNQIYSFDGVIRLTSPADGVSYRVELVEVSNNNNLLMILGSGKMWKGYNTINLNKFTVQLSKGKQYALRINVGQSGCKFEERFINTAVSIVAVI